MPVLLTCESIAKSFGSRNVFSGISLSLHDGDHLGVIGPNGAGKSTFLQIVGGLMPADEGNVAVRKGVRLAMVPQDSVFPAGADAREIVFAAARESEDKDLNVAKVLSRVGFEDHSAPAATLSGGWRKRLSIAAALAAEPDVLLLDEPTNHLDIEGILWLEKLIGNSTFASIFVTHDRYFLENCSTRVAEINRIWPQGIFAAPGNYSRFLEKRSEGLRAQAKEQEALENLVRREIEWLRRGAKARTSKSKARIQDAMDLQQQLADSTARSRTGTATIDFTATGRLSKRLIACEGISKSMGGRALFRDVNFALGPGARLGILGANGTGKTTLLRTACGLAYAEGGEITWRGQNIREDMRAFHAQLAYLGHEPPLKSELTARENLQYWVGVRRRLERRELDEALDRVGAHQWADRPVRTLSAGQKRRAALAGLTLMRVPLWLLDEPTTNLDAAGQKLVGTLIDEHVQAGGVALAAVHHELAVSRPQSLRRMELTFD